MSFTVAVAPAVVVPLQAMFVDRAMVPLSGGTTFVVSIRRTSDNFQLDFSGGGFKASGWTTRRVALAEVDATNAKGWYAYSAGFDTTGLSGFFALTFEDTGTLSGNPVTVDTVYVAAPAVTVATGGITAASLAASAIGALSPEILLTGTASAGGSNSITLTGGSATDNLYKRCTVVITSGTGAGQASTVLGYVGSTKVATIGPTWTTAPDNTSTFALLAAAHPLISTSGLLQGAASTTATLTAGAVATDAYYVDAMLVIRSGTGAGQSRVVTAYVGSTKVATVDAAWATTPDSTSGYEIIPIGRAVVVGTSSGAITSASFATDAFDANAVATSAVAEIQANLATGLNVTSAVTSINAHTDSAVAPLATSSALSTAQSTMNTVSVNVSAIQGTGFTPGTDDLHSAHPLLAGAATGSALTAAISTIDGHTDVAVAPLATAAGVTSAVAPLATSAGVTSAVAPLATSTGLSSAQTAINAHTDSATSPLASSAALVTAQGDLTAIKGSGFTGGVDDLHAARAVLAGAATGSALASAVTTIDAHTDSAVAPLATATSIAQLLAILAAAMPTASAGSSAAVVRSTATQVSGFFDKLVLVAINAAGAAARRITSYAQTNGAFTLDSALPFTPSAADQLYVLALPAPAEAGDAMTLTSGERVAVAGAVTGAGVALTTDVTSATAPLATASGLASAVAPLATSAALTIAQGDLTAIKGAGFTGGTDDLHSAHALLAGAATGSGLSSAVTSVNAHTDTAVVPLATASALTSAITSIITGVVNAAIASAPPGSLGAEVLTARKYNNKKALVQVGGVWELHIFDDDDVTVFRALPLKDYLGNDVVPSAFEPAKLG